MELVSFDNEKIKELLKRNSVSKLGVFGSTVRNEDNSESDVDLLVEFSKSKGLLAVIKLERELEEIIGRKIDLVTEKSISPYLRKNVLNDLKIIYEEK